MGRFKYTYLEEQLENLAGTRQLFERWMEWHPQEECWFAYINFELRYDQVDKVHTGTPATRPSLLLTLQAIFFSGPPPPPAELLIGMRLGSPGALTLGGMGVKARAIYERLIIDHCEPKHWIKYAKFEIKHHEMDKARR